MSREIEADFIECSKNDEKQCQLCTSFVEGTCQELEMNVPNEGYCDFFQAVD
jgi:hypothetical protein